MTLTNDPNTCILKVTGTLDIDSANRLRETLLDCFLSQPCVTADLSEVDNCDTSALQVILAGQRDAASQGKAFSVTAPSVSIIGMAAALGFSIYGTGESRGP